MPDTVWMALALPFFGGLLATWLLEAALVPRPVAPWARPGAAVLTHMGVWVFAFALELMLFRRPYVAIANVLAIQVLLILVNNAKFKALREPFVFPDFEYFVDAMRHPRLYLPFLGLANALAAAAGYGAAMWLGLALEPSIVDQYQASFASVYLGLSAMAAAGLLLAWLSGKRLAVSFDAVGDLRRLGFISALWSYGRSEHEPVTEIINQAPFRKPPVSRPTGKARDLICIQSESFFDIRRSYPLVNRSVLKNFDALRAESLWHGRLNVCAWGANTVRTEFAFLSGLADAQLGVHRYNPYRRLAHHKLATLASHLRSQGYRTICVHPYHASFYQRHKVLPQLGFDDFITIEAFHDAERFGAYVSDQAVSDYVVRLLETRADDRPLYLHVITMENHGPLHWEKVGREDAAQLLAEDLPKNCEDLLAYVRHLRNADASFRTLAEALRAGSRPALLCIYGDHVPIMSKVYAALGQPDGATDYLVWRSDSSGPACEKSARVESLADLLVRSL